MSNQFSHNAKRQAISEFGRQMLEQGLTKGTGGNISANCGDEIAISPSGMPYDEISPEDVPTINLQGDRISGDRTPSSERRMHAIISREREDVNAVVHTHSPYATTFASLDEAVRPSHYLIAFVGEEIPVSGYATYGTADLAELALDALGDDYDACLLRNHGTIAVGNTIEEAFERSLMVEYCARIHYQARNIGEPTLLPNQEIERLRRVLENYGQTAQDNIDPVAPAPDANELADERESVATLGVEMLEQGLTKGTGGNMSARDSDRVAINPSGVPYDEVTPEAVPIVDLEGEQVAGELAASSETPMHTMIYRERDDVGGIVHTHSPYATTFASLNESIPASHYLIAFAGDKVPVAGYGHPGTADLGRLAVETLGDEYDACLLQNHGTIAVGNTVEEAFERSLMVEYCARIHYQARNIGEPTLLPNQEIDTLTRRFWNYGQTGGE